MRLDVSPLPMDFIFFSHLKIEKNACLLSISHVNNSKKKFYKLILTIEKDPRVHSNFCP